MRSSWASRVVHAAHVTAACLPYFYVSIIFNPTSRDNMRKYGGFFAGYFVPQDTADVYRNRILTISRLWAVVSGADLVVPNG